MAFPPIDPDLNADSPRLPDGTPDKDEPVPFEPDYPEPRDPYVKPPPDDFPPPRDIRLGRPRSPAR